MISTMKRIKLKREYEKWCKKMNKKEYFNTFLDFLLENDLVDENKINEFAKKLDY